MFIHRWVKAVTPVSFVAMAKQVREDREGYYGDWTHPGFRALAVHRFGTWVRQELRPGPLRTLFRRLHKTMFRYVRNHYGIELPVTAVVGRRVVIGHQSGIVVHPNAIIGDGCLIRQNVTIGARSYRQPDLAPRLGRRVEIGCRAAILGAISVGDDVRIGANVVVTTDVPPGTTLTVEPPRMEPQTDRGTVLSSEPELAMRRSS